MWLSEHPPTRSGSADTWLAPGRQEPVVLTRRVRRLKASDFKVGSYLIPQARSSDMRRHPATTDDDHDPARRGVLASMCLALVLVVASVSSINLALTGISIDLGTTSSQLTWIAGRVHRRTRRARASLRRSR